MKHYCAKLLTDGAVIKIHAHFYVHVHNLYYVGNLSIGARVAIAWWKFSFLWCV